MKRVRKILYKPLYIHSVTTFVYATIFLWRTCNQDVHIRPILLTSHLTMIPCRAFTR